ncbi:MAG TPA: carboxypeptidase-like regulatory domain-containing protein, partial [Candidatus Eremiobacteraceae bacterium]|nr:carboxypeptidase-like regulatory domain-containing protein [Candidatus Eremiobacteraceae bacterium]
MTLRPSVRFFVVLVFSLTAISSVFAANSWTGMVYGPDGKPVAGANVRLHEPSSGRDYAVKTSAAGEFRFESIEPGAYNVTVEWDGKTWRLGSAFSVTDGALLNSSLTISGQDQTLALRAASGTQASGGEHLSSGEVSSLPLNERDFSKLLLLAAGTMTDTNGAANFTQQFAVNGQRGNASVFAMDGADTSDPELGGATFSNFNVDAIQEVQSSSGVMPAEI